jgi:hypothetical protein
MHVVQYPGKDYKTPGDNLFALFYSSNDMTNSTTVELTRDDSDSENTSLVTVELHDKSKHVKSSSNLCNSNGLAEQRLLSSSTTPIVIDREDKVLSSNNQDGQYSTHKILTDDITEDFSDDETLDDIELSCIGHKIRNSKP